MLSYVLALVSFLSFQGKTVGVRMTSLVDLPTSYKVQLGKGPVAWDLRLDFSLAGQWRTIPRDVFAGDSLERHSKERQRWYSAGVGIGILRWHRRPAFAVGRWNLVPWWGWSLSLRGDYAYQFGKFTADGEGWWRESVLEERSLNLSLGPRIRLDVVPPFWQGRVYLQATAGLFTLNAGYTWRHDSQKDSDGQRAEQTTRGPEVSLEGLSAFFNTFNLWLMFRL